VNPVRHGAGRAEGGGARGARPKLSLERLWLKLAPLRPLCRLHRGGGHPNIERSFGKGLSRAFPSWYSRVSSGMAVLSSSVPPA
jgi:hypothetical protein